METHELNQYRCPAGWLDFATLLDDRKCRPGDTLTIHSIQDLGIRTAQAFDALAVIAMRGIELDYQAVAECPWSLYQAHRQYVKNRKVWAMLKAKENGANPGGRPDKQAIAIHAYNDAIENGYPFRDIPDLHDISWNTFIEHMAALGWPLTDRNGTND